MTVDDEDMAALVRAVLDAAVDVNRWYYDNDALWIELTPEQRQEADAAIIRLHEALDALEKVRGESAS